jgi:hypothetical protein
MVGAISGFTKDRVAMPGRRGRNSGMTVPPIPAKTIACIQSSRAGRF